MIPQCQHVEALFLKSVIHFDCKSREEWLQFRILCDTQDRSRYTDWISVLFSISSRVCHFIRKYLWANVAHRLTHILYKHSNIHRRSLLNYLIVLDENIIS